jgi:hypothetical protein
MISFALSHQQENDKSQYHKRKQVSRIIKHLTHQLMQKTECKLPNDVLIDRWVHIALRHHHIAGDDWQKIIYHTLQAIHFHHKRHLLDSKNYTDNNGKTVPVEIFLLRLLLLTNSRTMYFR